MDPSPRAPIILGRYALFDQVAKGGMATVSIGRLLGPVGFARTVAVKRLHPQLIQDQDFVDMFLDEARLAARVRHPNVVPIVDVVETDEELFLVMDFVLGEALNWFVRTLRKQQRTIPFEIAVSIVVGALHGLHAAHEVKDENGNPLNLVHRDVSPQNIMVAEDGVARVVDFGVAKAASRVHATRAGQVKGKLLYMAPEQVYGQVDRRADVYSAAVTLWELLAGRRPFDGANDAAIIASVTAGCTTPPSAVNPSVPRELDEVIMKGMAVSPDARFPTARAMAVALERAVRPASQTDVGEWVEAVAGPHLAERRKRIAEIERTGGAQAEASSVRFVPTTAQAPAVGLPIPNAPSVGSTSGPGTVSQNGTVSGVGPHSAGSVATAAPVVASGVLARPATRRLAIAGVIAVPLIALVMVGLVIKSLVGGGASTSSPAASHVETKPPATASATAEPPKETAAPTPPAPETSAAPAASAAPPADETASAAPSAAPAPAKKPVHHTSCDPPYTIDKKGLKHFKPECL